MLDLISKRFEMAVERLNQLKVMRLTRGHSTILYLDAHPDISSELLPEKPVDSDYWLFIEFAKWELGHGEIIIGNESSSLNEIDAFISRFVPSYIVNSAVSEALDITVEFDNDVYLKVYAKEFSCEKSDGKNGLDHTEDMSLMTLTGPKIEFEMIAARGTGSIILIEDEDIKQVASIKRMGT